ncbi:MauE/DoxX family redox-associated membrane protein [Mucilaginibacter sp.]|uniref:MauE/DoxX family redox-associated membrane protein n=1 Tax=Mucilaginibacter sp. TaxID=1882438 RepID=UPI0035BC0D7A
MQPKSSSNHNQISWQDGIAFFLILLFIYTAVSKLSDFDQFQRQMKLQTIPVWMQQILILFLPGVEIITGLLLAFTHTRLIGLYLSAILMTLFTGYVALVLINYFEQTPCSCGGVIKILGWKAHFVFNIFFLLLSILGIYIFNRERRTAWH